MKLDDVIHKKVQQLPEAVQREVLSFVDFVAQRDRVEDDAWSAMSVAGAMRASDDESWPEYTEADLKQTWA